MNDNKLKALKKKRWIGIALALLSIILLFKCFSEDFTGDKMISIICLASSLVTGLSSYIFGAARYTIDKIKLAFTSFLLGGTIGMLVGIGIFVVMFAIAVIVGAVLTPIFFHIGSYRKEFHSSELKPSSY